MQRLWGADEPGPAFLPAVPDVELSRSCSGVAGGATRRWRAPGTHAASVCAVPRWQRLQRPPESGGSVALLQVWPATLPHHPSSWAAATSGLWPPCTPGDGVQWPRELVAREEVLLGRRSHPGDPNHTLQGSWEPSARFPLVFWGITLALRPAGQVPESPGWCVRSWAGGPGDTGGRGLSWACWLAGSLSRLSWPCAAVPALGAPSPRAPRTPRQHCAGFPLCGGGSFNGPLFLLGSGAPRGSGPWTCKG